MRSAGSSTATPSSMLERIVAPCSFSAVSDSKLRRSASAVRFSEASSASSSSMRSGVVSGGEVALRHPLGKADEARHPGSPNRFAYQKDSQMAAMAASSATTQTGFTIALTVASVSPTGSENRRKHRLRIPRRAGPPRRSVPRRGSR